MKFARILDILGIDGAVSYTVLSKAIAALTSFCTVFFLAKYLSKEEQGYYYTFMSVLSVQVFFELGLNTIISQFVAHQMAYCTIEGVKITGPKDKMSRLSSLLRFCAKWYSIFSVLFVIVLIIVGYHFFKDKQDSSQVVWQSPWVCLVCVAVLNFLTTALDAILQGLSMVTFIAKKKFWQYFLAPLAAFVGLYFGVGLYVCFINALVMFLVSLFLYIKANCFSILKTIWNSFSDSVVDYFKEIFPYQWKIALSWISGFFIYQLFNPVLFEFCGPVVAGQMGMTISAASGLQAILLSWISTKVPLMSSLIEKKDYIQLDKLFFKTLKIIFVLSIFLFSFFFVFVWVFQKYNIVILGAALGERFLDFRPLVFVSLAILINVHINAFSSYLRCHLKEPLLINSIVIGLLSCLSAYYLTHLFGLEGLALGYFLIQFFSLVWVILVFCNKRKLWHSN